MECDVDYAIALSLQEEFTRETCDRSDSGDVKDLVRRYSPQHVVDESWELLDPHPDIHELFVRFDAMFFDQKLVGAGVEVRWSPRMTL